MVNKKTLEKYQPTIGMECHVQLNSQTKLFARVSNDAKDAEPNTTVSPICFGLPGVLPYLNEGAIEMAIKAGLALSAKINRFSKFDRKHYFYPDLPKGYQITQYDQPIVGEGYVDVPISWEPNDAEMDAFRSIRVGIERAHLEEDAGKLTHPESADYSLVDLNRAGTPLLEIVSKPDIKSPGAAKAYARELYLLMKYARVSDVDLYHGHMRFDVNISVAKKGSDKLGTRAEVKNLNSFRAVEKAAQYEYERQVEVLEKGDKVVQETRGWHDDKQKTFSQRGKEEAHDYRYFPEPDLPPLELDEELVESLEKDMPMTPSEFRARLEGLELDKSVIELLVNNPENAAALSGEDSPEYKERVSFMAKLMSGPMQSLKKRGFDTDSITLEHIEELYDLRKDDKINSNGVDTILELIATAGGGSAKDIAEKKNLLQQSDTNQLTEIVVRVINGNPKPVEDYKSGEAKALGFLTGQVMKESKGQANPKIVQEILKRELD